MTRTFTMLRTHKSANGTYTTDILNGKSNITNWTYTVESDRFSTYTLAYTDTSTTQLSLVPTTTILRGGGSVTLTVTGVSDGSDVTISCDDGSIKITKNADGTYSAVLPNSTKTYTFTASSGGKTATCTVDVTKSGGSGGSSSSSSTYTISVNSPQNGIVSVNTKNASKGSTVTIIAMPDEGYRLDGLIVTDKNGKQLTLTDQSNGKYTFIMPASKVNVEVRFTEHSNTGLLFIDVNATDYYYDAVAWALDKGITDGTSATTFTPGAPCTRAQVVTFLWRAAGSPITDHNNPFTDVHSDAYYYDAVLWAVEKGITIGTSDTTFTPDTTCTRGQIATFLHRYAGAPLAATGSVFADVAEDAYYAQAVAWAAEEGITNGTSNSTFSPNADCIRGQIVTFLYRYLGK